MSTSAWKKFFDWPRIVLASAVARSGPDMSSAIFRVTAARLS